VVRPARPHHSEVRSDYCEQLEDTVVTDCTRTCWPPDIDELLPAPEVPDVEVPDVEVPEAPEELELPLEIVPLISTFSPTCLLSSLSWPSRMYRLPLDALELPAVPLVLLVLEPLVPALDRDEDPLPIWAFARTN
jgi:hypothetical protein